jgi:hypothetical protein
VTILAELLASFAACDALAESRPQTVTLTGAEFDALADELRPLLTHQATAGNGPGEMLVAGVEIRRLTGAQ